MENSSAAFGIPVINSCENTGRAEQFWPNAVPKKIFTIPDTNYEEHRCDPSKDDCALWRPASFNVRVESRRLWRR
jgi:hypothetical protein